jgi:hypothetical protein
MIKTPLFYGLPLVLPSDGVAELFCVAVGLTRMVNKSRGVFRRIAIKGIAFIQAEDIDIACG